jgi:uncharacterized protein
VGSLLRQLLVAVALVAAGTPEVPQPTGFITDRAGVIDAATRDNLTRLLEELQQKTGAEIAVLTVDSTAPLDDFTYAMQVADAWKPGKKGEDTGVLVLVAVGDRKVRILPGYGLEGILPDGLVGQIQDREMVPEFRAGRMAEGIRRGVVDLATRIAVARGVQLTGVPAPRPLREGRPIPLWALIILIVVVLMMIGSQGGGSGLRGRRRPGFFPGGFGGGGGGGFGGGGGGFGGFGGGGFGGGGAGRSW